MSSQLQAFECEDGQFYAAPSAVISPDAQIGSDTKIWHNSIVLASAQIGRGCIIGSGVNIEGVVGDDCKIQSGVLLYHGVTLESDVFVGPGVTFTNDLNPRAFDPEWQISETLVKQGASLGARSVIVCGNTIGELSLVAAGSVVTKDVESLQLVKGNPAKHGGWVNVRGQIISREVDRPQEVHETLRNIAKHIAEIKESK